MDKSIEKVIFLDIDGVLNNFDSPEVHREVIDKNMVLRLKRIVDASGANIILTSSWRLFYHTWQNCGDQRLAEHYKKLMAAFEESNITVYGVTNEVSYGANSRPEEINEWLGSHQDIKNYVILDDSSWDWGILSDYVVTTRRRDYYSENGWRSGLEDEDADRAISILSDENFYRSKVGKTNV